jgi:cytochrome b561
MELSGTERYTPSRYTTVAIILHWLIALTIIALLAIGLTMTSMQPSTAQVQLFQLHKSLGITVLALSLIRLAWRLLHKAPPLPPETKPWERIAAHGTHALLYIFMIGMPLTGWAIVSTSSMNVPTVLFGVVSLPHLPILSTLENKKPVNDAFASIHSIGAWILIGLLVLHIAAALFHQFIRRDEVMYHMVPFLRKKQP